VAQFLYAEEDTEGEYVEVNLLVLDNNSYHDRQCLNK
jgi:hypothetical protein